MLRGDKHEGFFFLKKKKKWKNKELRRKIKGTHAEEENNRSQGGK